MPTRQAARKGGGLVIRTARSLALVALRKESRRTSTGATGNSPSFSRPTKVGWGLQRFVAAGLTVRLHGQAGEARNQPFEGSCSRSVRSGRSRTNGVVVVDARSNRETGAACRSETQRGATLEARGIARPMEGALDHQYSRRSSRIDVSGWSWPRARRHLLGPSGRGVTRSAVTGASEDGSSVDVAGRKRPLRKAGTDCIRSAWGVVKRAMHLEGSPQGETPPGRRTKRGCPSSKCRWQKLVARISGR